MLRQCAVPAMLGVLFLAIHSAKAQPTVAVEILDSGLYRAETAERVSDGNAVGETRSIIRNVVFYEKTSRVPAVLGTRFGFRYRLHGVGADDVVELTKLTHFPSPGLTNPRTGRMQASNSTLLRVRGDATPVTGFSFGKKLAEQRYVVSR